MIDIALIARILFPATKENIGSDDFPIWSTVRRIVAINQAKSES